MASKKRSGVYRRAGSDIYHFDFRYKGARYFGSTSCTDKREAEAYVYRVREDVMRCPSPSPDAMTKGDRPLSQAINDYIEQHLKHRREARGRTCTLRIIEQKIGGGIMLSQIDLGVMVDLRMKRSQDFRWNRPEQGPLLASTVNMALRTLDGLINYGCEVWGVPKKYASLKRIYLKQPTPKTRVYTFEEEDRICAHLRPEDQAIVRVLTVTGLRRNNVVELKWEDVDLETGVIYLRVKGGDPETIPLTQKIRAIIEERVGNHPVYVFSYLVTKRGYYGKRGWLEAGERYPARGGTFLGHWQNACKKAGVKGRVHDCRHTAGTRTLRATNNIRATQKLLKHKSIEHTERYTHLLTEDVLAAMLAVEKMEKKVRARRKPELTE